MRFLTTIIPDFKMTFRISIALVILGMAQLCWAQHDDEHHHDATHETQHGKHSIALFTGFTHVPSAFYEHETHEESTGKWVPTLGLEYGYSFSKRWGLFLLGDVELDKYYIKTSEHDELERNNVVILAAAARYKLTKRIAIFAGPGYEWEFQSKHSVSFFVFKTGIAYDVEIENGWELAPAFSFDFKEQYSSYAFGIAIGKRF